MTKPVLLFEDRLTIESIDEEKYENISRVGGKTAVYDIALELDINSTLFPVGKNEVVFLALYSVEVIPDMQARDNEFEAIINSWDYVVYGKIFKQSEETNSRTIIFISFGGLLMSLCSDKALLSNFLIGQRVFLMLKK